MADSAATQSNEVKVPAEPTNAEPTAEAEALVSAAAAETDEENVSRISAAVARAKLALEEVKQKVSEYDTQYKASETASAYLGGPIQKAQAAFDELASTASMLKDKSVEIPTKALTRTLSAANGALEQITELANKYDEKFALSDKVQKAVSIPREKAAEALIEVSKLAATVSAAANAQLQGVNHGIVSRARSLSLTGAGWLFSTAAALDGRYSIQDKVVGSMADGKLNKAIGKASELDEKYNVKQRVGSLVEKGLEKGLSIDSSVTGGKVTPLVLSAWDKGFELATGGLAFVQTGYESAKQDRQGKEPKEDATPDGKEAPADAAATNGGYDNAAPPAAPTAAPAAEPAAEPADATKA